MLQAADNLMPTQLQELYLSGMEDAQIWAQLELRGQVITKVVETLFEGAWDDPMKSLDEDEEEDEGDSEVDELSMEGMDVDAENTSPDEDEEVEGFDLPDEGAAEEQDDTSGDENMPEHITKLANSSDEDKEPLFTGLDLDRPSPRRKGERRLRNRHPTLDDDFFSIIDFNQEIEAAEAQSKSRGRLDEDSDEESIDLFQVVAEDDELADEDGHAEGGCMCIVLQVAWGACTHIICSLYIQRLFRSPSKITRRQG